MRNEEQLQPAVIAGLYDLAAAVVRGLDNADEQLAWARWGAVRQVVAEMHRPPHPHQRIGARRMGQFEGRSDRLNGDRDWGGK